MNVKILLLHNNISNRHSDDKFQEYSTHNLETHLARSVIKLGLPELQGRRALVIKDSL